MTDDEILSLIREALSNAVPEKHQGKLGSLGLDSSFESLGVDSLALLDASAHIEMTLGVEFTDDRLSRVASIADLVRLIREQSASAGAAIGAAT
jgi:acyl carrier protein